MGIEYLLNFASNKNKKTMRLTTEDILYIYIICIVYATIKATRLAIEVVMWFYNDLKNNYKNINE